MITAQTVRAALRKLGGATASAVEDHLQVQTFKERVRVQKILLDLRKAGQVKFEEEIYSLCDQPGRGSVQAKLWEFACLRFATAKPFTVAEAARLAECDRDYTKRYCRWLWGAGYLAIVSRGRAGAMLYQVVGGKERCSAPPWNRRAEKRKGKIEGPQAGTPAPLSLPAVLPVEEIPPIPPVPKGGAKDHRRDACATKLDAALEDFGRALVEVAGGIDRAWEIIRQMKDEILAVEDQGHEEPADGHH